MTDQKTFNPGDDVIVTSSGVPGKIICVHFASENHITYSIAIWAGPQRIVQAVEAFEIRPAGLMKGE